MRAAINAVHDEAERAEDTGWPQILALYGVLELPRTLDADRRLAGHHRLARCARTCWRWPGSTRRRWSTTGGTAGVPEQNYLRPRAAQLAAEHR